MSSHGSSYLVAALLSLLASKGLAPEALDPWYGWPAFKEFVRAVAEEPDPGVSVQLAPGGDRAPFRLYFTRQVLTPIGDRLEPVGAVVCEFVFAPRRRTPLMWAEWSLDYGTFERFVDVVEQTPIFADLLVTEPRRSAIYWEEA
jgi:hypothetical protein